MFWDAFLNLCSIIAIYTKIKYPPIKESVIIQKARKCYWTSNAVITKSFSSSNNIFSKEYQF